MPTTGHGIFYPNSSDPVFPWEDMQDLADSVEAALDAYEAWTSWTLTWTGLGGITSVGAGGQVQGIYEQIGKLVHAEFRIELGTGFTWSGGTLELNLPVTAYTGWLGAGNQAALGFWTVRDDSVPDHYAGTLGLAGPSGAACHFNGAWDGTAPKKRVSGSGNIPVTWAAGDIISGALQYRAA